jgi:hypothetical protein
MNHEPYETWILSPDRLPAEQEQSLQTHLANCPSCQQLSGNWSGVDQLFRSMPAVQPAVGFTARWQVNQTSRALQERIQKQRRQTILLLILSVGGAALLLSLLVINYLVFDTPSHVAIAFMYQVISIVSLTRAIQDVLTTIIRTIMTVIPPIYWFVISSGLGLLSLLWMVSLRKIIHPVEVKR